MKTSRSINLLSGFFRADMIRHIVLFKIKSGVTKAQRRKLESELMGLKKKIRLVREIEVKNDIGGKPNSYDLALNTLFDSMADVEKYAAHPEHVKVLDTIKELCESTVKIDYETRMVAM